MTRVIAQRGTRFRSGIRSIQRFGRLRSAPKDRLLQARLVCSSEGIALSSHLMNRRDSKTVRQPAGRGQWFAKSRPGLNARGSGSYSETGIVTVRSRKVTAMRDKFSQTSSRKTTRSGGRMNGQGIRV
jgi:hypothetical protein